MDHNDSLRSGTAFGTLLSVMPNILSEDIAKTIVLAVIGAVASFGVTWILKSISRIRKK